ncbi:LysM peptidoglycan-binding domain-containing protein [Aspergillus lucknowensis]|uniref:LysM domain-containing protein n=1 Tax=Aspergillus lucknowensis TaxID=176173 RepID=A0ABR4L936_9EURO
MFRMSPLRKTTTLLAIAWGLGHALAQDSSPSGETLDGIAWNCNAFYTVKNGDSCDSVEEKFEIKHKDFLKWNPKVSDDCKDNFWTEYSYCVGIDPDQTSTSSTSTSTSTGSSSHSSTPSLTPTSTPSPSHPGNTTTTPYSTRNPISSYNLTAPYTATAWPPEHTLGGQPKNCTAWYQVRPRDSCESIVNQNVNRLTMEQLIQYNPTLKDCNRLYVGWYICLAVRPTGTLSLPWYTGPTNLTIPSATSYVPSVTTIVPDFTAQPQASGIPSSCQDFYKATEGDSCGTVLKRYGYVTKEQFFEWNPSLDGDCQGLQDGFYYCVANFDPNNLPLPPTVPEADASPTASGTVDECKSWYQAVGNNNCARIASAFGTFSEKDFISWNPSVGDKCKDIKEGTYYCVSLPDTPTTRTNTPTTPTESGSMPTQTGVAEECTRFWFVSSADTCQSIISSTGASPEDFHEWNPAVGDDCAGLKPDYYVCVSTSKRPHSTGGSVTTLTGPITPAPSTSSTPSPTGAR